MDNTWVAQFYEETDPVKRMEMLEAHGEDAAGEEASEEASEEAKRNACRKELWVVRYGKRRPRKDEFVGGFVELKAWQRQRQSISVACAESRLQKSFPHWGYPQ